MCKAMKAFLLVRAGLMWFLFRLSVPEIQLCEQWSGEAWTRRPMAISVERRQPNKQRKAWCAQVTAQPAVKKHLTLEIVKAITCSRNLRILITGQSHLEDITQILGEFMLASWRQWQHRFEPAQRKGCVNIFPKKTADNTERQFAISG